MISDWNIFKLAAQLKIIINMTHINNNINQFSVGFVCDCAYTFAGKYRKFAVNIGHAVHFRVHIHEKNLISRSNINNYIT